MMTLMVMMRMMTEKGIKDTHDLIRRMHILHTFWESMFKKLSYGCSSSHSTSFENVLFIHRHKKFPIDSSMLGITKICSFG